MNAETKHTQGPWDIRHSRDGSGDIGITAPNVQNVIAECFADMRKAGEFATSEAAANARLIAAAPDLLEAALATRKLVSEAAMTGFNYADGDWAERLFANQAVLSAAIAKAERQP